MECCLIGNPSCATSFRIHLKALYSISWPLLQVDCFKVDTFLFKICFHFWESLNQQRKLCFFSSKNGLSFHQNQFINFQIRDNNVDWNVVRFPMMNFCSLSVSEMITNKWRSAEKLQVTRIGNYPSRYCTWQKKQWQTDESREWEL